MWWLTTNTSTTSDDLKFQSFSSIRYLARWVEWFSSTKYEMCHASLASSSLQVDDAFTLSWCSRCKSGQRKLGPHSLWTDLILMPACFTFIVSFGDLQQKCMLAPGCIVRNSRMLPMQSSWSKDTAFFLISCGGAVEIESQTSFCH